MPAMDDFSDAQLVCAGLSVQEPDEAHDDYGVPDPISDGDDIDGEIGDGEAGLDPLRSLDQQQQRKVHRSVFDEWSTEAINDIGSLELQKVAQRDHEGMLSLKEIIESQDAGRKIIGAPRDYQVELFDRAKAQNTIAVLDTGSGKTLIAVLLLKHVLDEELERREKGLEKRISFFIVSRLDGEPRKY